MSYSLKLKRPFIKNCQKPSALITFRNMKKVLMTLMFFSSIGFGCKEKCKDVYTVNAEFATMEIDLRATTGGFLISDGGSPYLPSDVSVYDDQQKQYGFKLMQRSTTGLLKNYYLLLPIFYQNQSSLIVGQVYNQRVNIDLKGEIITLDYEFKIEATECSTQLEYMNVDYEGQRIASISHGLETKFTITK